jgi:hypothetical protein
MVEGETEVGRGLPTLPHTRPRVTVPTETTGRGSSLGCGGNSGRGNRACDGQAPLAEPCPEKAAPLYPNGVGNQGERRPRGSARAHRQLRRSREVCPDDQATTGTPWQRQPSRSNRQTPSCGCCRDCQSELS